VLAERLPACGGRPLRALDAGAGTGQLALALARASSTPVTIEAVDISEQMLQRADNRMSMLQRADNRMSRAGLDFAVRQADARQLPYDDNTFDVAMTAHLLEHMPNPRLAIAEMVRVTRPGGLVVACLTRRSALGLYIHLKWRTHMVTPALAKAWFAEVGLRNPEYLSTQRKDFFRRMSIACAGTKSL
jgi:demethylmenaquinone methyltransferase/2-methoxy-6-polyprenyl-1,4-benzoquinol methylase